MEDLLAAWDDDRIYYNPLYRFISSALDEGIYINQVRVCST